MARYIVCTTEEQPVDSEGNLETVTCPPVLCETRGEAEGELARIWEGDRDWSVWEVVQGRCQQRSVVFKNGKPEIQS